jgi:Tol biopolymer transport system component
LGDVTLEPGGARLDATYRLSVTLPMPGGPVSVTLRVPQYYKQTPSGWVRAMPAPDFWGPWRKQSGKYVVAIYLDRDASLIEPLVPRLDDIMQRICDPLVCPAVLPITFDNTAEALAGLDDFSYGYDATGLRLPSPHLIGLPADAPSREELYRAYGTRLVQALIYEASNRRLTMTYLSSQEFVRWHLAQAGLAGPFINEAITRTLVTSPAAAQQPLGTISVRSRPVGLEAMPGEVVMPLAFDFLERQFGAGAVSRLLPALSSPSVGTLGEAVAMTQRVNSSTLEQAWQKYLQDRFRQVSASNVAPTGELALWCAPDPNVTTASVIFRVRANGEGGQFAAGGPEAPNTWSPRWSPDGKWLAYGQGDATSARVLVMAADAGEVRVVADGLKGAPSVSWTPDGRLQMAGTTTRLFDLASGAGVEITGTGHTWSPDGTQVAFVSAYPNRKIWIADANGRNARQVGVGSGPAWSPDGKRLAFLDLSGSNQLLDAKRVGLADVSSGSVKVLTSDSDLLKSLAVGADESGWMSDVAWSPDGSLMAVAMAWSSGSAVVVLNVETGAVRAQWQWGWTRAWFPVWAWSADSRHLAVWVNPDSLAQGVVDILDTQTGTETPLPGRAFDWSPDGKWLAVTQSPNGVLIVTPDLSIRRSLDTPNCFDVSWRPGH